MTHLHLNMVENLERKRWICHPLDEEGLETTHLPLNIIENLSRKVWIYCLLDVAGPAMTPLHLHLIENLLRKIWICHLLGVEGLEMTHLHLNVIEDLLRKMLICHYHSSGGSATILHLRNLMLNPSALLGLTMIFLLLAGVIVILHFKLTCILHMVQTFHPQGKVETMVRDLSYLFFM